MRRLLSLVPAAALAVLAGCSQPTPPVRQISATVAVTPVRKALVRPRLPAQKQVVGASYSGWLVAPSGDTWHMTQIGPGLLCGDLPGFTVAVGPPVTMGDQTSSALWACTLVPGSAGWGISRWTVNAGPYAGYTLVINKQ